MKPVEAFSQHLPIPIYLALWESSDIIWCSMPPGLNPRSLRPDPGQLPIGSNLDNVTSERMRGMYVTHDKRYSKEWDILHQKMVKQDQIQNMTRLWWYSHIIIPSISNIHVSKDRHILWSPVHHTCRPIEAWIDCLRGSLFRCPSTTNTQWQVTLSCCVSRHERLLNESWLSLCHTKGLSRFYPNWSCHHRNPCGITWGASWPMYLVEVGDKSQHVEMCWDKPWASLMYVDNGRRGSYLQLRLIRASLGFLTATSNPAPLSKCFGTFSHWKVSASINYFKPLALECSLAAI